MKKLIYTILFFSAISQAQIINSYAFANEGGGGSLPADIVVTYPAITDPTYPNYPDNDEKYWYFYPSIKGNKITITINSINTESGYDFLHISEIALPYESISPAQPILQTYTGTSVGTPVSSSIGLRLRFISDVASSLTGFTFTVSETADGTLPLTSLSYAYTANDRSVWYFEDGVTSFSAFSTEAGYDYLYVYEVNGNVEPTLLYSLNGIITPSDISSTKRLIFYMKSDAITQGAGFTLTFTPN